MAKRVVITGIGIISCIGNNLGETTTSLRTGKSGIEVSPDYIEVGMNSHVAGRIHIDYSSLIPRKHLRFMGMASAYAYLAMQEAIENAQLPLNEISSPRIGVIIGSGGGSPSNQVHGVDRVREKGMRYLDPYKVTQTMGSTVSACLSTSFGIKGINYSISSACATSTHCIGNAYEHIRDGRQDIIFSGGSEEEHWMMSSMFDAMRALSRKYNDKPTQASRPYDHNRDGFVIAGGAGVVVLEELEHAQKRGAPIWAEIVGYGANSDGMDIVAPSGEGAVRCMQQALATTDSDISYINTHGTSTPAGDVKEVEAIIEVFGGKEHMPPISSTKSLTGHSLGAAGAHEVIYCLLMMHNNFITASANIETPDPALDGVNIVTTRQDHCDLQKILTNNFGFGGTNAALVLQKVS